MKRVPVLCRWLLNATAPIVPADVRDEWRREWYGELWHFIDDRIQSRDPEAYRVAFSHCMGAVSDAVYLRRNDEQSRTAVSKVVRHPAFYVAAMAAVVLLIAALTNGFESTRRMVRPLPYPSPEHLVVVRQVNPFMGARLGLPLAKMPGWKKARTLEGIAAYTGFHALVDVNGLREVMAAAVEPEFFKVLGAKAQLGQLFQDIDAKECVNCAVISNHLWRTAFKGDRAVIGKSYSIAGSMQKVIGVLPDNFWFFTDTPAVWTLLQHSPFIDPRSALVYAIARLRPFISEQASVAELRDLYRTTLPRIRARQLEECSLVELTQDPLYRTLPVAFGALFFASSGLVLLLPNRRATFRSAAYFTMNVSLASAAVSLAAIEFAYAPGLRMTGVRGFGPEAASLWMLIVGFVIAISWAWTDQRKRCRTCLCRLTMPVQMGSRGHVLMDRMSTELVCPNGHGVLWAPEDPLESHPKDRWLHLDESWHDLFAVPNKD